MVVRIGVARVDEGHLVDVFAEVGEEVRDHFPALAARTEGEGRLHDAADRVREEAGEFVEAPELLAVVPFKSGFVVPRVDLAGTSVREDPDDAFGFRREMRFARGQGIERRGEELFVAQEGRETEHPRAGSGTAEEGAAGEEGHLRHPCRRQSFIKRVLIHHSSLPNVS